MATRADRARQFPDIGVRVSLLEGDMDRIEREQSDIRKLLSRLQWLLVTTSVGFAVTALMLGLNLARGA